MITEYFSGTQSTNQAPTKKRKAENRKDQKPTVQPPTKKRKIQTSTTITTSNSNNKHVTPITSIKSIKSTNIPNTPIRSLTSTFQKHNILTPRNTNNNIKPQKQPPKTSKTNVFKKKKHDGNDKKGTYNKSNPHKESYSQLSRHQQKETRTKHAWWIVEEDKEEGHCSDCRTHQNGLSIAKGISIYAYSSSNKKLNAHGKLEKHDAAVTFVKKLNDPNNAEKLPVYTSKSIERKQQKKK
eukprot:86535_1